MIDQILPFLATLHPSDIIDVILLTFVIYRALLLIQGTRTIPSRLSILSQRIAAKTMTISGATARFTAVQPST